MPISNGLLSPSPSLASTTASDERRLPVPRTKPLTPGSRKEIGLINYLDEKILRITRRYGMKFSDDKSDPDDSRGYTSFDEVSHDINAVLDLVWISSTPALQIPYLLTLAGLFCSYMPAFPFSTSSFVFSVVTKLDDAFAHLLRAPPPVQVSTTDKVRIRSLVERTRVVAIEVASGSGHATDVDDSDEDEEDIDEQDDNWDENPISLKIGTIYNQTLSILGDSLVPSSS